MATFTITLFSPSDVTNLTTPGPAGAFPTIGDEFQLKSDWSNATDARTMTVTDDDATLGGDPRESGDGDTSQQTAVVTHPSGSPIANGYAFSEYAFELIGPDNAVVTVHSIYIGNSLVGYAADSPVQPGANYKVTNAYQPNGAAAPGYSSFDAQLYDQDPANIITGTNRHDSLEGGSGSDSIFGLNGDDMLGGGTGMDTIKGGGGADTIDGGTGTDILYGDRGDDLLIGGTGRDTLDGGSGNDHLDGGPGNDVLSGGDAATGTGARLGFRWSDIPDPDNGGAIDDRDWIGSGTQSVGGVDVSYAVTHGIGRFENETQNVRGIDDGDGSINSNSALDIRDTGSVALNFSQEVQNVSFRINNFDASNEHLVIRAYDADGNQIAFNTEQGSNVLSSDTDTVPGVDTFEGAGGEYHDRDPEGSVLVKIPGPIARIEMEFTSIDKWTLAITDVFFDDPTSHADADGDDTLVGGSGDDVIDGGDGNDALFGGTGDDTLDGGAGSDLLTGGKGDDRFAISGGNDTIDDFNSGNSGTLNDGKVTNNDRIDLSRHYDHIAELWADQADDGILNQSNSTTLNGRVIDYSDNTQFGAGSLTITGASADRSSFTSENTGVVCFTAGTAIRTPGGDVAIDDLRVGDLVTTMDNGPQPIRWIGRRTVNSFALRTNPNLRPVLVRRGVLGAERNLLVSAQHGLLMGRNGDHLARAKHLAQTAPGIRVAHGKQNVTYIHLMFDAHQIVFSENVASESFYPGPMALNMMETDARTELFRRFPKLSAASGDKRLVAGAYGGTSRRFAAKKHVEALARHMREGSDMTSSFVT
ncbi:Hint domain-containing protein [Marivita sp. S0852]|uniref:Hint domain-containing protein n=1 Tax=Marivita sp. S0852 TaxID=3373893 RepID=UPI0039828625